MRRARESESPAFSRLVIAGQEAERRRVSCGLHDTVLPELRRFAGAAEDAAAAAYPRSLSEAGRVCA
jgi:signal transduction histidine kinase